ncbi:hypothetical protein ACFELO_02140 [Oceanicaulis sp. LC35]|uniref:hypothetical protein n=1 Tax=Oceanicaulis sp. LC35 TaxID=3349635 RepID=UPI003F828BA2
MRTLFALAAASFITTGAMATDVQLPERASYTAVVFDPDLPAVYPGTDIPSRHRTYSCRLDFDPNDDTHETGSINLQCGQDQSSTLSWSYAEGQSIEINGEGMPHVEFGECDAWPSIAVGETVSDPCWMTSLTGTPVQVTREN